MGLDIGAFGSINTAMMEFFDDIYVAFPEVVAAATTATVVTLGMLEIWDEQIALIL